METDRVLPVQQSYGLQVNSTLPASIEANFQEQWQRPNLEQRGHCQGPSSTTMLQKGGKPHSLLAPH